LPGKGLEKEKRTGIDSAVCSAAVVSANLHEITSGVAQVAVRGSRRRAAGKIVEILALSVGRTGLAFFSGSEISRVGTVVFLSGRSLRAVVDNINPTAGDTREADICGLKGLHVGGSRTRTPVPSTGYVVR
jgi:hypothetical protein